MITITEQQQEFVTRARVYLNRPYPFFSALAYSAPHSWTQAVPTAATDGVRVLMNPDFMFGTLKTQDDRLFVYVHEIMHIALSHVARRGMREPMLWNIAADISVNGMLVASGLKAPQGAVMNKDLQHLSVEEIYSMLQQMVDKQKGDAPQNGLLGPDLGDGQEVFEPSDEEGQDGKMIPVKQSKEGYSSQTNKDFWDKQQRRWTGSVETAKKTQQSGGQGDGSLGEFRDISSMQAPSVKWQDALWAYLTQSYSDFGDYDRRHMWRGAYVETLVSEKLHVAVCIDTSGSIDDVLLGMFMAEISGILSAYHHVEVLLWFADTVAYGPYTLTRGSERPKASGGGGTSFVPFFEALEKCDEAIPVAVYLTDGYGTFPDREPSSTSVIWARTPGGLKEDEFPFGQVINLNRES